MNWLSHEKVFCNPPYDTIQPWAEKCFHTLTEAKRTNQPIEIHLLIPARTETDYFHEYIKSFAEIHFIRGRLKFRDLTGVSKKPIRAPFPSIVCIEGSFINSKGFNAMWISRTAFTIPWLVRDTNTYGAFLNRSQRIVVRSKKTSRTALKSRTSVFHTE